MPKKIISLFSLLLVLVSCSHVQKSSDSNKQDIANENQAIVVNKANNDIDSQKDDIIVESTKYCDKNKISTLNIEDILDTNYALKDSYFYEDQFYVTSYQIIEKKEEFGESLINFKFDVLDCDNQKLSNILTTYNKPQLSLGVGDYTENNIRVIAEIDNKLFFTYFEISEYSNKYVYDFNTSTLQELGNLDFFGSFQSKDGDIYFSTSGIGSASKIFLLDSNNNLELIYEHDFVLGFGDSPSVGDILFRSYELLDNGSIELILSEYVGENNYKELRTPLMREEYRIDTQEKFSIMNTSIKGMVAPYIINKNVKTITFEFLEKIGLSEINDEIFYSRNNPFNKEGCKIIDAYIESTNEIFCLEEKQDGTYIHKSIQIFNLEDKYLYFRVVGELQGLSNPVTILYDIKKKEYIDLSNDIKQYSVYPVYFFDNTIWFFDGIKLSATYNFDTQKLSKR